jgi:hypothetical protein
MQGQVINHQFTDLSYQPSSDRHLLSVTETSVASQETVAVEPFHFQTCFEGYMEMYSPADIVAEYLNAHDGWFCRCAQPMVVEPLEDNGYTLTIGRYSCFDYEIEPQIAVVLHPPQSGIYRMSSVPVPGCPQANYEVDYQASMELLEIPSEAAASDIKAVYKKHRRSQLPCAITRVKWELSLNVSVQLPRFIYKLPHALIQTGGDRLLTQIVRQVSPGLTYKVQQDFHARLALPMPPKSSRNLQKVAFP